MTLAVNFLAPIHLGIAILFVSHLQIKAMVWLLVLLACTAHVCCSEERSIPPSPVQGVHQPGLMRLHDRLKADLPTPDVRPLLEARQNMSVNLTATLFQIADVDDVRQTITVLLHFLMEWKNEFISWDPSDYSGAKHIFVDPNNVWTPTVATGNRMKNFDTPETLEDYVDVYYDGMCKWRTVSMITYGCKLVRTDFPFDAHNCTMELSFYKAAFHSIKFGKVAPQFHEHMQRSTKFKIMGIEAVSVHDDAVVDLTVGIKRIPYLILSSLIFPIVALSSLMIISLMLPPDSDHKIDIQMTSALTYSVYFLILSDYIPPYMVNEEPYIVKGILILLTCNTVLICYTALMLRIINCTAVPPNPKFFKVMVVIGKFLLITHPTPLCPKRRQTKVETSITPVGEHSPKTEKSRSSDSMKAVVDWIQTRKDDNNCRDQWCHTVAVVDRLVSISAFVAVFVVAYNLMEPEDSSPSKRSGPTDGNGYKETLQQSQPAP